MLAARTLAATGTAVWPVVNQRPVLDVLLGESLSILDERVEAVLLSTFEATAVTGPLAVLLSGDADAGATLADLAGNELLVTAYSDSSGGEPLYRYHPLLVELLRRPAAGSTTTRGSSSRRSTGRRCSTRTVATAQPRCGAHWAPATPH